MALTLTNTIPAVIWSKNPAWIVCQSDLDSSNTKVLLLLAIFDDDQVVADYYQFVFDKNETGAVTINYAPILDKLLKDWYDFMPPAPTAGETFVMKKMCRQYSLYIYDNFDGTIEEEFGTTLVTEKHVIKGGFSYAMFPQLSAYLTGYITEPYPQILTWWGLASKKKYMVAGQPEHLSILTYFYPDTDEPDMTTQVAVEAFGFNDTTMGIQRFSPGPAMAQRHAWLITGEVHQNLIQTAYGEWSTIKYIDAWIENANDNSRISEKRTYWADHRGYYQTRHFVFVNSLGGWDTVTLHGEAQGDIQIEKTTINRNMERDADSYLAQHAAQRDINKTGKHTFKVKSQVEGAYTKRYMAELFLSQKIVIYEDGIYKPVLIRSSSANIISDNQDVQSVEFEYEYAFKDSVPAFPLVEA